MSGKRYHRLPSGLIVGPGQELRRGGAGPLVRNVGTGEVLKCVYRDCEKPGRDLIRIEVAHEAPRFEGEKLIYIFCSEIHKQGYISDARGAQSTTT